MSGIHSFCFHLPGLRETGLGATEGPAGISCVLLQESSLWPNLGYLDG